MRLSAFGVKKSADQSFTIEVVPLGEFAASLSIEELGEFVVTCKINQQSPIAKSLDVNNCEAFVAAPPAHAPAWTNLTER